jgi:hypothetical protein
MLFVCTSCSSQNSPRGCDSRTVNTKDKFGIIADANLHTEKQLQKDREMLDEARIRNDQVLDYRENGFAVYTKCKETDFRR